MNWIVRQRFFLPTTDTESVPLAASKEKSSGCTPSHAAKSPAFIARISASAVSASARTRLQALYGMQWMPGGEWLTVPK